MGELKEFKPKPFDATPSKPEKPARVIGDVESARKKKQPYEAKIDTSSVLADALELVREGQLTDEKIDELITITENEKTLLKVVSGLFERLRTYDEEVEELRALIKKLEEKDASK
ncbi:MAG: hypothetical protein HYX22_01165 [Candidatus Yanofskybacteria bacterium]|nr:hypothetical protein [Candidatus Yanofskybacteria bacterium]